MNDTNELLSLARAVATLRHEMGFDEADRDNHKIFLRLIDEMLDVVFKQEGNRDEDYL